MNTTLKKNGAPSWRKVALQRRSRDSERALARAARDLLSERPYPEIRVEEVAQRAGVSVGGFYGRFRSKAALLHLADLDFMETCLEAFDIEVPEDLEEAPDGVLRRFVTVMVQQFRIHRQPILQAMRHADEDAAAAFRERAMAFNSHVHGRLRRLLGRSLASFDHTNPTQAVNMAIFFASSAARDAVLRGSLAAYPVTLNDDELTDEIVLAATRYLRGDSS
jgi:AcrR family transcriptional regulator